MLKIDELKKSDNIVKLLLNEDDGNNTLAKIGMDAIRGYDLDEASRSNWKKIIDEAMKIAKQETEPKNHPWPGASNIKFPLIADAAIEYAARTMPEIVQNEKVVKVATSGMDPKSAKYDMAERVSRFMSYQLVQVSPDWEDGMSQLLQMLPIVGTVFKKTYYSTLEKRNISELCVPDKVVVNYNTRSLESARRITHVLQMYENDIIERQRRGVFRDDIDVDSLSHRVGEDQDCDSPIDLLEQHCWLDLDDDGYKEPYIITVHKESAQVLRILARFKKIEKDGDTITCIYPDQYFTDFHFIRSPDGGFYSMGFGSLLLPLNSAINTLWNQLIDSGTLHNTQGGFVSRGARVKGGELRLKQGEWKILDSAGGTDIKQNIMQIPTKEPSQTLFNMLNMAIQIGKDLSSTNDVMQGKGQTQNVATGTIGAMIEQGTKVYTAINKGLYRSLRKEYNKLYELNCKYLTQKEYSNVLDDPQADIKTDFVVDNLDIHPIADPSLSSFNQRMGKMQAIMSLKTADPRAVDEYLLKSLQLDQAQIQMLLPKQDPNAPPPPEAQKDLSIANLNNTQAQAIKLQISMDMQNQSTSPQKNQVDLMEADARIKESQARVWKMGKDAMHNDQKLSVVANKSQSQAHLSDLQTAHKIQTDNSNLQLQAITEANKAHGNAVDQAIELKKIESDSNS